MKNFIRILSYILTFFFLLNCQSKSLEDAGENIIKDFYIKYMNEVASSTAIEEDKSIKQKYCTKELLYKIKMQFFEEELDYDPFLKAQDVNLENISSLSVKRDSTISNKYLVSYIDNYSKRRITINLLLNDSLKIKSVW